MISVLVIPWPIRGQIREASGSPDWQLWQAGNQSERLWPDLPEIIAAGPG
jgi:hypothetical protein